MKSINNINELKEDLYSSIIKVQVDSIINDTPKTKIIVLKRTDKKSLPIFYPGDYINIYANIDGVNHLESFSLFSSNDDAMNGEYRIVVKSNKKKPLSKFLFDNLKYQDKLLISKPLSDSSFTFSPLREEENIIAIGYDNDIVSFYSLAHYLIKYKLDYKLNIIHICSNDNNVVLKEKFKKLNIYNENINYEYIIINDDNMRPAKDVINKYLAEFNSFFVAGNIEFYKNINKIIYEYNLPKKNLRFKKFNHVVNRNMVKKYELTVKSIEQELTMHCSSNESLFKAILKSEYGKNFLLNNDLNDEVYAQIVEGSVMTIAKFDQEANLQNQIVNLNDSYPCENVTIRIN